MHIDVFDRRIQPEPNSGCWLWLGKVAAGYGQVGNVAAHRITYETEKGPIPAGLVLDHICENTFCVNPAHLEPVTSGENISRAATRRRLRAPPASATIHAAVARSIWPDKTAECWAAAAGVQPRMAKYWLAGHKVSDAGRMALIRLIA